MLRRILFLCTALALDCVTTHAQQLTAFVNKRFTAHVVNVVDGDTVVVLIPPSRRIRVRLQGVDTPEAGEPFSQQARTFTRVLMFDRDVDVSGKEIDRYDRLVARVVVDNADASEAIIAAGLGCTFRRYLTDASLEAAQDRARKAHLGFWVASAKQPACVARAA